MVRYLAFVIAGAFVALFACPPSAVWASETDGSTVGVVVDPAPEIPLTPATESPITVPPDASTPSTVTPTTVAAPTTVPQSTAPPTTVPDTPATVDTLVNELPQAPTVHHDNGFIAQMKSVGSAMRYVLSGAFAGKSLAALAQAVLPASVADVIVPAVHTASTFAFPIGLAVAVIAFLALQQRIDSSDPKLAAAPLAHDDDPVTFQ